MFGLLERQMELFEDVTLVSGKLRWASLEIFCNFQLIVKIGRLADNENHH